MSIERVTTLLELLGILALTAALGLVVHARLGLAPALVAVGLACFMWSAVVEMRRRPSTPVVPGDAR